MKSSGYFRIAVGGLIVVLIALLLRNYPEDNERSQSKSANTSSAPAGSPMPETRSVSDNRDLPEDVRKRLISRQKNDRQRQEDLGIISTDGGAPFFLLGSGGTVPSSAISSVGLTEADRPQLQQIVGDTWKKVEQSLLDRLVVDENASSPDLPVFYVPASETKGPELIDGLRAELTKALGESVSEKLLTGLNKGSYFAGFGRQDLRFKITSGPGVEGRDVPKVEYACSNPDTGETIRRGNVTVETFESTFGSGLVKYALDHRSR